MKYLVCVLVVCLSCSKTENPNKKEIIHPTEENFLETGEVTSLIDTTKASNFLSKIISSKEQIATIGQSKEIFAGIDKVTINNGFVFILDKREKRVAKFSLEGRFITNIGNEGKGPGELSFPNDFVIYKDDVFISDRLFSIKKGSFKNEQSYDVIDYLETKNIVESICRSEDTLVLKSMNEDSVTNRISTLQFFHLKSRAYSKSIGNPYITSDPAVREVLSEGLIACSEAGVIHTKYSLPYIYYSNKENESFWISEIQGYQPLKLKEEKGRGLTNRWHNKDFTYDEFESLHVLNNKLVVQIQLYENRIQEGKAETKPLELRTYLLDIETGEGHYEGIKIPKIYYIDESYVAVKGETQNPTVEIYKMGRACCNW